MREPDDCTVKCPSFTKVIFSDVENSYSCDYTEWAYTLFASIVCTLILAPVFLLICAVCKRSRRGSNASRGSNSQYQVVSEGDIEAPISSDSYGTFNPGQKLPVSGPGTSPLIGGTPPSPTSSRASVAGLVDNVSLNMRNNLADYPPTQLPPSALAQDPAARPRMPTPANSITRSVDSDLTNRNLQVLDERRQELQARLLTQQQDIPVEKLVDVDSQSDCKVESSDPVANSLNSDDTNGHMPRDVGYVLFESNTNDSCLSTSKPHDDANAETGEPLYHQLEGPGNELSICNGHFEPPQGESTPRKDTFDDHEQSGDDQETLVGSCDDDDSVLHLEESLELNKGENNQPFLHHAAATLPTSPIPYYVPLHYGKDMSKVKSEGSALPSGQVTLESSPGSDSVEILPAEVESKFLDSLSTMGSSYHTAADMMEEVPQILTDDEAPADEELTRGEEEERRPRHKSRADFENLLLLNIQQFSSDERNGIFLLRDSVSEPGYKVLTMYAKVPTSDQEMYHFKISVLDDGRSSVLNGLRTLPNLPSLLQYLREEKDVLPCTLTREIQWNHDFSASSVMV